jgi:dienelactone hydrolase
VHWVKDEKRTMSNWDTQRLFADAQYRQIDTGGAVQSILYRNEPYLGTETEVFAYLGVPDTADGAAPGMVCVHGGGGRAFRQWVEMWVRRGYAAVAMDLSGRGADGERLPNGGPEQEHAAKFNTTARWKELWTYHAVAAVIRAHTILGSLDGVDPGRIGVTGISWGGYVCCIVAGVDTRFGCAISVYGCGYLQHNSSDDWMQIFCQMTPSQRQAWHERCDPSVYLGNVTMPMLFVSGTNDHAYPLDSLQMSAALPRGPVTQCVRVEMAHGHEPGWAPDEIALFADQHLRDGVALPRIDTPRREGRRVEATFSSRRPIVHGYLMYTQDRVRWQDRKWHTTKAALGEGRCWADLPKGTSAYLLGIEDDRGAYVSSSVKACKLDHTESSKDDTARHGAQP